MPAAHPLDAVQAYLSALQQQRDQPVHLARQALARAYQRAPAALPPGLVGLF